MAKIRVPYLVAIKRGTKSLYYWQPSAALRAQGWKPHRLSDNELEAADQARRHNRALDAWRAAPAADQAPTDVPAVPGAPAKLAELPVDRARPGSVDELIREFKASRHFTKLKPKTRRSYTQCLDRIAAWCGDKPRVAITPTMVQDFYEKLSAKTPAFAAAIVRVGSVLFSRGRLLGLVEKIDDNPFMEQNLEGVGGSGLVWPRAAIDWFVAVADAVGRSSIGTAVLLDSWIGQRQADVLRLGQGILAKGGRAIRQAKTGAIARLPVHLIPPIVERVEFQLAENERLARARETLDAKAVRATTLFVDERTGLPWNEHSFRHAFAEVRAEAARLIEGVAFEIDWLRPGKSDDDPEAYKLAFDELQFMHLRHTAVVYLAEAGCDALGISPVTGHSPKSVEQILNIYAIKTGTRAGEAFKKRLAHEAAGQAEG